MTTLPKLLCCNDSIKIYTSLIQQNEHIVSQTLSLHDPASLQRMQVPCRAFDCEHLQCFDYSVILYLNKSNERSFFKCSVCNETRNPDKIYIDFVTFCLLRMYKCSESFKLYRDGTLRPSGPISPEYKGLEINTIFDIKKLSVLPGFQLSAIHLRQLLYTSVFDINDFINKSASLALLKLITKGCRKLPSKDAELMLGIDKLRPFNSNTWLGLQHSFQTLPSVGDKKGALLVKELREEYDKVSLHHLNKITSGPLDFEEAMMSSGSGYEIKKMEEVMVDLCGDDDDEETVPSKPFIKTSFEDPSSSSLSAADAITALPSTTTQRSTSTSLVTVSPSSSSSHRNILQPVQYLAGSSSSYGSSRQMDVPNASNPHIRNDINQLRSHDLNQHLPPAQSTNANTGRNPSVPQNNFNVPLPLRRENGVCPDPVRGRNMSPANSQSHSNSFVSNYTAPSSSSFSSSSEPSSAARHSNVGNGNINQNSSSNQYNSTLRPPSPMVGMTAGPAASLSKPYRKPLTGANFPGGASTATICRGEVSHSMQRILPRLQGSVEMRPISASTRAPVVSHLHDRFAAYNRWLLEECVTQCTQSTQTESMDGGGFIETVCESNAAERLISSRPAVLSSSSGGISRVVSTAMPVGTSSTSNRQGGQDNPTLYWLDPTGILVEDHGALNQHASTGARVTVLANNIDDDGDVTMDYTDEMDDDMQAILCAEIDQMNSETRDSADDEDEADRIESDRRRYENTDFEVNSNYSSCSDNDSIVDNVILNQDQNEHYDSRNINSTCDGDTNAMASSSDRHITEQSTDNTLNMQHSGSNVQTDILNSSINTSLETGSIDRSNGLAATANSSSSHNDITPGLGNSSTPTDTTDNLTDGVIIGVRDDWTIRLVDRFSSSTRAPVTATSITATSAADSTATITATAPADVISAVGGLAAHADPGPGPRLVLTATDAVAAGVAPASELADPQVAVDSNSTTFTRPVQNTWYPTNEEFIDFFREDKPGDGGDTTESENEMFDGRVTATRKSPKGAIPVPLAPADSAEVTGQEDTAGVGVEAEQSDVMRRDLIAAAWAEMETETEPEVDVEVSQALSTSQSTASATPCDVDITGPIIGSVSEGNAAASTASITATTDMPSTSTISAASADGGRTSAASGAESMTHVPDVSMASTNSGAPSQPDTTAMTICDPSSSTVAPVLCQISGTEGEVSAAGNNLTSSNTELTDAARIASTALRTAPHYAFNERIYNSSGRCNTTSTLPSVSVNGFRRKTPLDVSSSLVETAQLPVEFAAPPSSSSASSLVVPTVTSAAAPISELIPSAANSVLPQILSPLPPLDIPTDIVLEPSTSALASCTLIPFSSTHSSTSASSTTPASSTPIDSSLPPVQSAVTVLPVVPILPLLALAQVGNHIATVPRSDVDQVVAEEVTKETSTEPPAVTIPKRKSATASPRISEVQDPIAVTGVTPHTAVAPSASSTTLPPTAAEKALESAPTEVSSTGILPQGEKELFSSDDYGFWDEGGVRVTSEQESTASDTAPQSTAQTVETMTDEQRLENFDRLFNLAEKTRVAERALKKAEIRRNRKKYGVTPDGIAEWAYQLAKGTQCMDLSIATKSCSFGMIHKSKKKLEQWNRAVARLKVEGHYIEDPPENEPAAAAPASAPTSSSSSSSATSTIAVEVPVPVLPQPIVHATTVGDWKCSKCRRIIDGNKRSCTECNTARPLEVTVRNTDILRRCQSCSIAPSILPCAACAAMVPATRAAFRPMTAIPKAGKERRSALSHEKPPYVEPVVTTVICPNKRPLPAEGQNGAPSDQDNRNKVKINAKKSTTAKDTALYMAALSKTAPAPGPTPARHTMTQQQSEKVKKAKTVPASSSSSTHSTTAASGAASVAPNSKSLTSKADAPRSTSATVASGAVASAPIAKATAPAPSSSTSNLYIDLTLDDDDDIDQFGRAKQTSLPTAAYIKVAQDSSVKRKHSTAFGGAEESTRNGDTAGSFKKPIKKVREGGSTPNPPSTAGSTAPVTQPKPPSAKPPSTSVNHNPSSSHSNTSSVVPPRLPPIPHPNPPSSAYPGNSLASRPTTGPMSTLNSSNNSVQARPIAPDKRPVPAAPHGDKLRPIRPITKSIPTNIPLNESDSQETSFSALCVNDFSFP